MTDRDQTEKFHTLADVVALLGVTEDEVLQAGARGLLAMGFYWPEALLVKMRRFDGTDFADEGTIPPTGFIRLHPDTVGWIWRAGEGRARMADAQLTRNGESTDVSLDIEFALQINRGGEETTADGILLVKQDLLVADGDLAEWQPAKSIIERQQAKIAELEAAQARIAALEIELAALETGGIQIEGREATELDAVIALYRTVAKAELPAGMTPAQALFEKAEELFPDMPQEAQKRLATVANWDKERGRRRK